MKVAEKLMSGVPVSQGPSLVKTSIASRIVRGKIKNPFKVFLYGKEGIGKSTFGAGAPDPVFLGCQAGTEQLDVGRLPEPRAWKDDPEGLDVFNMSQVAADEGFKTLVVDTVDWVQNLVEEYVCKTSKDKNGNAKPATNIIMAYGGYGNGFKVAADEWREYLALLEKLRLGGMNIILLGHAVIKKVNNPEGPDYDCWTVAMNDKSGAVVRQWADSVYFASTDSLAVQEKDNGKGVAYGTSERYIFTKGRPASDGKDRYGLPDRIPLDFKSFYDYWKSHQDTAPTLRKEAEGLIQEFPEGDRETLTTSLTNCGEDVAKLNTLIEWMKTEKSNV